MKRKEFLQVTTLIIGGISLKCFPKINEKVLPIKVGLITDLHYADRIPFRGNNRFYSESKEKLAECIDVMNTRKVDFLVELGDFKDQDEYPIEENTLQYLNVIEDEFNKFSGPLFHVLGNHDHDSITKQQFLDRISNWGFKKAKNYYSFNLKGFHFVVLDANYTSEFIEYNHGNFDWKDANIPPSQIEWLDKDLRKNSNNPTVVFIHQRLDDIYEDKSHFVKNSKEIREILIKHNNVMLVLQGHDHKGGYSEIDNIIYYTLKAAIEGSGLKNNSFAILEIDSKLKMEIIGFHKALSIPLI